MIRPPQIQYQLADKQQAIAAGGVGTMLQLAKQLDLRAEINQAISLFKLHLPYDEADHVINIAFNLLAGANCLEHLEDRRCDEAYLNAVEAQRIPDPTTAGDFCRRFDTEQILNLLTAFNRVRTKVWKQQPDEFFDCAIIEADGTQVETSDEKKQGIGINYLNKQLAKERIAEFEYQPEKCNRSYRVIVLHKEVHLTKGQLRLFDKEAPVYFFYITNASRSSKSPQQVIIDANARCNQENNISQLKQCALAAPLNDLTSNWAYMAIASLAWNLKVWAGLMIKPSGSVAEKAKQKASKAKIIAMDFTTFRDRILMVPAQIIRTRRRLVYRLLSYRPSVEMLLLIESHVRHPLKC